MTDYPPRPGEVDAILRRGARVRAWHAGLSGLALAVVAAVAAVPSVSRTSSIAPADAPPSTRPPGVAATPSSNAPSTPPATTPSQTEGTPAAPSPTGAPPTTTPPSPPAAPRDPCAAGENGGATDRSVTATSVDVFSPVVASGTAFMHDRRRLLATTMLKRVNQDGGVCGRAVRLTTKDSGGNASFGSKMLREAMEQGTFAIPYLGDPDSLAASIATRDPERTRTPVVGVASGHPVFYGAEWVWPVGVADTVAARILARDAYRRGARTFGVVFHDAALGAAFDAEVLRLTGRHVDGHGEGGCTRRYCQVARGQNTYAPASSGFYADPPDFVAAFLDPSALIVWMNDPNTPAAADPRVAHGHATTEVALSPDFVKACRVKCDGLRAWSAYRLPCDGTRDDPAVRRYEADLAATRSEHSLPNVGGYAGLEMFLDALRQVGPELTRDRLRHLLDHGTVRSDITVAGTFSFADGGNRTMREYRLTYRGAPGPCVAGAVGRA